MGYTIETIATQAIALLESRPEGLSEHDRALLTIMLDNLGMVHKFDEALRRDGPLVTLPNSIVTAHPAIRPRDNCIRRALQIAKDLGLLASKPIHSSSDSPLSNFLRGPGFGVS